MSRVSWSVPRASRDPGARGNGEPRLPGTGHARASAVSPRPNPTALSAGLRGSPGEARSGRPAWTRKPRGGGFGLILLGWIGGQLALLEHAWRHPWIQVLYLGVGVAIVTLRVHARPGGARAWKETRTARWAARLPDVRSRRVVFLSHCLLNQNVRYLGGATQAGVVPGAVSRFVEEGVGLYQMPCPEQVAWGGALKPWIVRFYGAERSLAYRLRGVLLPLFEVYTRSVYRRLARRVARDAEDYVRAGFDVVGVIGVGDSPSCGVRHKLDLRRALPVVAALDLQTVDTRTFNMRAVRDAIVEGEGVFIQALREQFRRRQIAVEMDEHLTPNNAPS